MAAASRDSKLQQAFRLLHLGCSRSTRPLPSRLLRPCRSPQSLHCISAAPAALDRYPRGFSGHVAHPSRSIQSNVLLHRPYFMRSKVFCSVSTSDRLPVFSRVVSIHFFSSAFLVGLSF